MSAPTEPKPNNTSPRQRSTRRVSLRLDRSGGANQADVAGADINQLVATYKKHGTLPAVNLRAPLYDDSTFPIDDIHEMRELCYQAEDRFMDLPAAVRKAASNDWVQFDQMIRTPDGLDELVSAGLIPVLEEAPAQPEAEPAVADEANPPATTTPTDQT